MYEALLEASLGSRVDVVFPSENESGRSGEFSAEPLLPPAWNRVETPAEPEAHLAALGDAVADATGDVVFVLTPWLSAREIPEPIRARHGRLALHEIALLIAAERAGGETMIASLVPYPTVASEVSRPFRAEFFTRTRPSLVVTHDGLAGEIGLHSSFRTATIVGAPQDGVGITRFFRVPRDEAEDEVLMDLEQLLAREGGVTRFGYVFRERLAAGSSLSHELRSPELINERLDLAHLGELRRLDELFDVKFGLKAAVENDGLVDADVDDVGPLLIEARSIEPGGVEWDIARYRVHTPADDRLLQPGDVLVRALAPPGAERLGIAEWPADAPRACAASTVLVLRPRADVTAEQIRVAVQFLKSRLAMRVVRAMSAGEPHIASPLRRVLIPVADDDLNLAIRELGEAAARFRQWAEDAERARSDVFERVGAQEWRAQVLRAGARVREREHAAQQVDELGFRIRTMFPHPLAYAWRVVEASRPDYDGYKTILETAETLLLYAAVMALAAARAVEQGVPYLNTVAQRLADSPARGVNMGDWYSILTNVRDSKAMRARAAEMPIPEVMDIWRSDEADASLARLKDRRNDDSHARRPEATDLEDACAEARSDLETLFAGAEFLIEYPLRQVAAMRWRAVDDSYEYDFRDLRGDHHLVPTSQGHAPAKVEEGSLYVATRRQELCRVTPVLVRSNCTECRVPHTFSFDRLDAESLEPVYRGLEHRHSLRRPDLVEDLRAVGLLPPPP